MQLDIKLNLNSEDRRSHLLQGLDYWVQLGLLEEWQVRQLAKVMSEPIAVAEAEQAAALPPYAAPALVRDFDEPVVPARKPKRKPKGRQIGQKVGQSLRSLLDEISVIWLLFLGVFLVVVSSGLLAASQWQSFSSVGQYAVLLAYTLAFWVASTWTRQKENLQTTARMLTLTTLLLVPINFWMMDALGVLKSPVGIGFGGLSALLLSCLPLKLLNHRFNQLNLVGLSWLHWGWLPGALAGGAGFWPMTATYLGTIGTAANLIYQDKQSTLAEGSTAEESTRSKPLSFDVMTVGLAISILLFRSLVIAQIPLDQLGLAAGICGWLMVRLTQRKVKRHPWTVVGLAVLGIGWAICVAKTPPFQAVGVSLLALWLLWDLLLANWRKESLLALVAIAAQTYWIGARLIPPGTRDTVLSRLSAQLSAVPISRYEWMSVGFFPFILGLLFFAKKLREWNKAELSRTTEYVALATGAALTLMGSSNRFTAAANLLISTGVLIAVLRRRSTQGRSSIELVTLTHGVGLLAVAAWIDYLAPGLDTKWWAYIALGGAIAELLIHLVIHVSDRTEHWRLSTWHAGLLLSGVGYWLLRISWNGSPGYQWLSIPIVLTFVASHRQALKPKETATFATVAMVLQAPWMMSWPAAMMSFAVATVCMSFNSRILKDLVATFFTVGAALSLVTSGLWYGLIMRMSDSGGRMMLVWAFAIWGLWLVQRRLNRRSDDLSKLYQRAAQIWSLILMGGLLLWGSGVAWLVLSQAVYGFAPSAYSLFYAVNVQGSGLRYVLAAMILLVAALFEAIRNQPAEWRYWSLAWATEIIVVLGLALRGLDAAGIAVATLALGFVAQVAADVWVLRRPPYRQSWHGIPLVFALLGVLLGHSYFGSDTGLFTMFAGAIAIGVGRRASSLNPLSYIGLATLSAGAYELLIYRMMQASGGAEGDGFTLLALLTLAIAFVHKFLSKWLLRYLQISAKGLRGVANAHWLLGSLLVLIATAAGLSQPKGIALWTATTVLAAAYALINGNRRWTPNLFFSTYSIWTSLGILSILFCAAHNRLVWFPDRLFLITWGGIVACAGSLVLYSMSWERLGWPLRPWRLLSLWLPLSVLGVALTYRVPTHSLLIVGAFYAWMAKQRSQVRLSYLSILLLDWALLRYLQEKGWSTNPIELFVFAITLLYLAQIEPYFQGLDKRQQRHWMRTLASGLIGATALYQTEVSSPMLLYAAIAVGLSIVLIFAGLALKTRAFLYVGTGTFLLQVIRVLWLFVSANSLLLWAIGIVLGLVFIWIAATFESRRSQVTSRLDTWTSALETWD